MAGAPKGNQNAARAKVWSAAIQRVLARDKEGMEALARALINKAKDGDIQALKEIGDRLEGKVPQAIEGTGEDGAILVKWADA